MRTITLTDETIDRILVDELSKSLYLERAAIDHLKSAHKINPLLDFEKEDLANSKEIEKALAIVLKYYGANLS